MPTVYVKNKLGVRTPIEVSAKKYKDLVLSYYWSHPYVPGVMGGEGKSTGKSGTSGGGVGDYDNSPSGWDTGGGGVGTGAFGGGIGQGTSAVSLGMVSPQTAYGIESAIANMLGFVPDPNNPAGFIPGKNPMSLISLINNPFTTLLQGIYAGATASPPAIGLPGADTATGGIFGGAIGPLGGGMEGYGLSGPGPSGADDGDMGW